VGTQYIFFEPQEAQNACTCHAFVGPPKLAVKIEKIVLLKYNMGAGRLDNFFIGKYSVV